MMLRERTRSLGDSALFLSRGVFLGVAVSCAAFFSTIQPALAADARSTERLSYVCTGALGQRDITLFANGTVRLREGLWEQRAMYLSELGPDEVRSFLAVLDQWTSKHASESPGARPRDRNSRKSIVREPAPTAWRRAGTNTDQNSDRFHGVRGEWVEQCTVSVAVPGREAWSYEFSAYDVPPLEIARVVQIAEELAAEMGPDRRSLPQGYSPRFGDVLWDAEGFRYRVLRLTTDETGVELEGVDQPVRIYVSLGDLASAFQYLEGDGEPPAVNPGVPIGQTSGVWIDDDPADDEDEDDEDDDEDGEGDGPDPGG